MIFECLSLFVIILVCVRVKPAVLSFLSNPESSWLVSLLCWCRCFGLSQLSLIMFCVYKAQSVPTHYAFLLLVLLFLHLLVTKGSPLGDTLSLTCEASVGESGSNN